MLLSDLLKQMIDLKASDIFVVAGLPLTYKASGRQVRMDGEILTPADTRTVVEGGCAPITGDAKQPSLAISCTASGSSSPRIP